MIEVGYSEPLSQLQTDAEWRLVNSGGLTRMVIIILVSGNLARIWDAKRDIRLPQYLLLPANSKATMRQMSVPPIPLSPSHTVSFLTISIHPPWTLYSFKFNFRKWQVTFSDKPNDQYLSVGLTYPRNSFSKIYIC